MKKITVSVTAEGEVTITSTGYQGASCKDATRPFEEALGEVTAERLTPEYRQQPEKKTRNTTAQ